MRQVAALLAELRAEQARLRGEFARQAAAVHALQAAVAGAHGCALRPGYPHTIFWDLVRMAIATLDWRS